MTEPTPPRSTLGPVPPPGGELPMPSGDPGPAPRVVDASSPESDHPAPPEDRRKQLAIGCLTLIGGVVALLVVALVWVSSVFRPFPSLPPTGVLETTLSQPVRVAPDLAAELEVTLSLSGQLDNGKRSTGWPNDVAPVIVNLRLGGGDASDARAADLTVEAVEATPSFAVDADVAALADNGVVDAVRWAAPCNARADCVHRYLIAITRRDEGARPIDLMLVMSSRLEYPTSVPAPAGAVLRLTAASQSAAPQRVLIEATKPETLMLDPGAPAVVRDISVEYPAADGGPSGLRALRLRANLTPIGRPSPQPPNANGRSATQPPARVTLGMAGGEHLLMRDLTGGPMDVRLASLGVCGYLGVCSLTFRAVFETLDPRPDASYRLEWSLEARRASASGDSQAPRIAVVPAKPFELARAEASGEFTLTRKVPSATGTALVILFQPTGQSSGPPGPGAVRELEAVATVTVAAEVAGSTRRAPVIVTVGPSFEENGAPAIVTAVPGAPGTAIFRPLRSCKVEDAQCEEGYRIDAALAPSVWAIITTEETVTLRWRMTVSVGRFGSPPAPGEQLPTLVVQ